MAARNRFFLVGVGGIVLLIVVALVLIPRLLDAGSFRTRIESTLSAALDRRVTLGRMSFSVWSGGLVAQNAVVADDPAFGGHPFLEAPLVRIRVQVIPLIFSHEVHIEGFTLVAPQVVLLRADNGAWNYTSLGRAAPGAPQPQAQTRGPIPILAAGRLNISNGTLTIGSVTNGGLRRTGTPDRVYDQFNLEVERFSLKSPFSFTASVHSPAASHVSIRGAAGPIHLQDLSRTPLSAHIDLKDFDAAAAGLLDASTGITGRIGDVSVDAAWTGQHLHIAKLLIDSPKLSVVRAAASLPATAVSTPGGKRIIAALSADSLQVENGVLTVTTAGKSSGAAVYRQVNLAVSNYSPETSFPFNLSAQLPAGGSLSASGNAGPLDRQHAAATPLDVELSLKHLDLAANSLFPPGSGVGGLLDLDAKAMSDGRTLMADGAAHVEDLRLAGNRPPSPLPVDVRLAASQDTRKFAGQILHSTITIGTAVINVSGTYQGFGAATQVNLKIDAPVIPVAEFQAFLPSAGIKLPHGSRLVGGMLSTSLSVRGPIDHPVISGPLRLDDTELAGFDLASKLSGIGMLAGLRPGSSTVIGSLSMNLSIANGAMRTDNVDLVMPAVGSATGSGTVGAGGKLDYHLLLKLASLNGGNAGGSTGAARAESILSQLMGMIRGGTGKPPGGLSSNALKNGIPVAVGGTTSNPTVTPALSGIVDGAGRHIQGLGGNFSSAVKGHTAGNSLEDALGGLRNGRF